MRYRRRWLVRKVATRILLTVSLLYPIPRLGRLGYAIPVTFMSGGLLTLVWRSLYESYNGFDQWPNPHGPFYDWWLAHPGSEEYYEWLARVYGYYQSWS